MAMPVRFAVPPEAVIVKEAPEVVSARHAYTSMVTPVDGEVVDTSDVYAFPLLSTTLEVGALFGRNRMNRTVLPTVGVAPNTTAIDGAEEVATFGVA